LFLQNWFFWIYCPRFTLCRFCWFMPFNCPIEIIGTILKEWIKKFWVHHLNFSHE
jgi:hypothetical protein